MKQKILKALTNNVGLKILAVIFAFLLWLVVVNIDDPTQTRTFTSVVTVTNADVLKNNGKLYEIKDGVNTVSFRVTAKRSIIEKLSPSDFSAIADMNNLENEERVPVTITAKSYSNSVNISSKQNYLYVELEDEVTERFVIYAETSGKAENSLEVEEVSCSPTVLTVTGPEEVVNSIEKVVATANIDGVSSDFTESVIPKFYDSKGELVDSKELTLSVSTVGVSVHFVNTKAVDIVVKTSGTLSPELSLGSIKTDPSSVMIIGEASALNNVANITIPDTVINLSNITGSFTTTVDISSYLPDGVTLTEGTSSKVTISVLMDNEISGTTHVAADNIELKDVPDGLAVKLKVDKVSVNVFGSASAIAALTSGDIKGYIDCSTLTEGDNQNVVIQFENPEGITVQSTSVSVDVTKATTSEEAAN